MKKKLSIITAAVMGLCLMLGGPRAEAGFGDFFKKALTSSPAQLTDGKIADGLKEALAVGVSKTIALTGKQDGYFSNPAIKIPLPKKIRTIETMMRTMGMGATLDEWTLSMNRAAEAAAPQAKTLFLGALKQMTLEDAKKIYNGGDTAATDFFKAKTGAELAKTYKPLVRSAMAQYDVTRVYQDLASKLPPGIGIKKSSLENYVTTKALDGLFLTLGDQERAIRTDPAARVTELLKEVFSK